MKRVIEWMNISVNIMCTSLHAYRLQCPLGCAPDSWCVSQPAVLFAPFLKKINKWDAQCWMHMTSSLPSISITANSSSSPAQKNVQYVCQHTLSQFPPSRLSSTSPLQLLFIILIEQQQLKAAAFASTVHARTFWASASSQICFCAPRGPSTSPLNYTLLFTIFRT